MKIRELVFTLVLLFAHTVLAGDLLITNVNIVNPETKTISLGSLLIKKGKISRIYNIAVPAMPKGVPVLDGEGKYLIPGLHDMHSHNWVGNSPPAKAYDPAVHDYSNQVAVGYDYLYSGVTTYLDLFSPSDIGDEPEKSDKKINTFNLRERQRKGEILHPTVFVAGPIFGVAGSHGVFKWGAADSVRFDLPTTTGKQYEKGVKELSELAALKVTAAINKRHPDVIKIVFDNHLDNPVGRKTSMPIEMADAIIKAAKAKGTKTVAHVGTWESVEELAKIGLAAFTHLPHGPAPASTIKALKDNGTFAIPTLSVYMDNGLLLESGGPQSFVEYSLNKLLTPATYLESYLDVTEYDEGSLPWIHWSYEHNQKGTQLSAMKSLYDGGVKFLAGTDAGNVATIFGASLHREFARMKEAGVDSWSILRSATVVADQFLQHKRGAIKIGYAADFVLLEENPITDIVNSVKISEVIFNGAVLDREDILNKN